MLTDAIVFPEVNRAVLAAVPLPERGPSDCLVDVELSGVSVGTEVWALTGLRPPGDTTFPCVPGYQAVGVVREAGPEASLRPGERIFFTKSRLSPPYSVGNWMGSHVRTALVDGTDAPRHGYWVRLPDGVEAEAAVLSALAAVADRGLLHVGVREGDFCVVTGQGVIGQCAAQIARIYGARVLAADIWTERLELAARYSADAVVNAREADLGAEVRKQQAEGADLVVEASGNKAQIPVAIDLVRPLGRVLLQGWYPGDVAFDFHRAHGRRPTIAVTCGMDVESNRRAIGWIEAGRLQLKPLLTHVFKPQEAPRAYEMMGVRPGEFLGVAFDWRQ
jgi:3-hydroxyethyl bacteriochlorophyllide a dehydrogenase